MAKDSGKKATLAGVDSAEAGLETSREAGTGGADVDADANSCESCCCAHARHKVTERSDAFQADLQKRLNRVIGQLGGVKQMIDDNRYCGDVLVQLSAAESAVRKISELVLHNHMQTCVVEQIREGNDEIVDELMKLIHRFK